jgi:TRAP-type C4-dicarboxylate transport system permease small subunit
VPLPLKILSRLEFILIATIMLLMVVLYTGAIAVREFFPAQARNVAFVDEAARYLMVWMVFLALGLALAQGKQIAMTAFQGRFPDVALYWLRKLIDLTGLAFALYVCWIGFQITQMVFATGQRSPTLGISAGFLYASMPIGFGLLALRYGLSLVGVIDRWTANEDDANLQGH